MRKRLIVAALLLSAACRSGGANADDASIRDQVRAYLAADGFTDIPVNVDGGVVTLSGHLATDTFREKAMADAERAAGVRRVVDKIAVP